MVGTTRSSKLDGCITGVSCFTDVGCFAGGGFFTGGRQTHGGGSLGVGGAGRPSGYVFPDIEFPPCPGNTDDDTTGAANGPAFGTGDPNHGVG